MIPIGEKPWLLRSKLLRRTTLGLWYNFLLEKSLLTIDGYIRFKHQADHGSTKNHKACLVAKGYIQVEGLDYHETFAPVAKLVTMYYLQVVAVTKKWPLHQLDVHNAFLHDDLDEVYMTLSLGFPKQGGERFRHLPKSLYDLKQASRNWFAKFFSALHYAKF